MAVTARAQDLGNGIGYLYEVEPVTLRILSYDSNTPDGLRNMRRNALINSPLATNRPAVGSITITACAAAGNLTGITINGVNQIAANVPITTSVPATEAAAWAAAVNAFTPGSGPDYTAMAIGDTVFIFSPPEDGAAVNGSVITVSLSVGSTTVTTTTLANGATNQGIYDTVTGRLYYINADYAGAADPTSLTGAVDVTQYVTNRGQQTGIPAFDLTLNNDSLSNVNRYNNKILLVVDTQGGAASDTLAQINAQDFIPGDEILIIGADPTHVINVESAPVAAGTAPSPNIYLAGDLPYAIDGVGKSLRLMFKYDDVFGPIFTESARASAALNGKTNYLAFFDTDKTIKDFPYAYSNPTSKKLALSNLDTQATPALLAAIDGLLNMVIAAGTETLLSILPAGVDIGTLKLKLLTLVGTNGIYMLETDILAVSNKTGTNISIFREGAFVCGITAHASNDMYMSAALPWWAEGMGQIASDLGMRLITNNPSGLSPNFAYDSPKLLITERAATGSQSIDWELFSRADNSLIHNDPTFVLRIRNYTFPSLIDISPPVDVLTIYYDVYGSGNKPSLADFATSLRAAGSIEFSNKFIHTGPFLGTAVLVAGEADVVLAGSAFVRTNTDYKIFLSYGSASAPMSNQGHLNTDIFYPLGQPDSFRIRSSNIADTNPVNWWIAFNS